jgi:hypothetical protein
MSRVAGSGVRGTAVEGWFWLVIAAKGAFLGLAGISAAIAAARRLKQASGPCANDERDLGKEARLNQQFSMGEMPLGEYERRMREIRRASQ